MIYTSYFGVLKKLPANVIPVSICGKAPAWYSGIQYKKLAPKYGFFMEWKLNHDNEYYKQCFREQVLTPRKQKEVISELLSLLPENIKMELESENLTIDKSQKYHIAFICYEKPGDFCHRFQVANWFKEAGINVEEYKF